MKRIVYPLAKFNPDSNCTDIYYFRTKEDRFCYVQDYDFSNSCRLLSPKKMEVTKDFPFYEEPKDLVTVYPVQQGLFGTDEPVTYYFRTEEARDEYIRNNQYCDRLESEVVDLNKVWISFYDEF